MHPLVARAAALAPCLSDHAAAIDHEGAFPTQEFRWLAEAGLTRADVIRLPTFDLLQVLWHIGRGNLAVGRLVEGHVNALQLVDWFGSEAQKARSFAQAEAGALFAVWNTQSGEGVRFVETQSGCEMRGAKTFCSGAGSVARPIVTGATESGGWQMAIVPTESAHMEIDRSWWQPLGMRASASFAVDFGGTKLGREDLLGAAGDYYRQPAFSGGAIRFCAVQLGGAASLFEGTREFLRETGRANDAFQQARVGQMATKIESGWHWLRKAGESWDALGASPLEASEGDAARMVALAAMMRLATEEIGLEVMALCEKSVGARGLMRGLPFERVTRDLTIYLKQPHLDEIPGRVGKWALESMARADELWD